LRRVVSISLGTSKRDKSVQTEILGTPFQIDRIGTDGDRKRFAALFSELDGKVDALGVGGCDLYLVIGDREYPFREITQLVSGAKVTPVVDGSGLKHTLERETVQQLQCSGEVDFSKSKTLLMSAVDRYGMAQALHQAGGQVVYGDLLFGLGLPLGVHQYRSVEQLGRILLPIITRLPLQWFYPTGEKQEERKPKFGRMFEWADVIAGDSLFIYRYAPDRLDGKTILTQSVRKQNIDWLRSAGVHRLITTTPVFQGETFATNVMEALLVSLIGKPLAQVQPQDYLDWMAKLEWKPEIQVLNPK